MNLKQMIATIVFCLAAFPTAKSQADEEYPTSFLGYLKPGILVGVISNERDSLVQLEFLNEEQFSVYRDASNPEIGPYEVINKYEALSKQAEVEIEKYLEALEKNKTANTHSGANEGEPRAVLRMRSMSLCTVKHVGEDYFVVEPENGQGKRVIPKQRISGIHWHGTEYQISARHLKSPKK